MLFVFVFCKQKTAYEMRISDWSSDVCSSDLDALLLSRSVLGERRQVEQQDEDPRPLDVAEELVAQPPALVGTLDEPGQVGHDELHLVVKPDHAEVRLERGERVVGDLRDRKSTRLNSSH